jgi:hypothetical protein
VHIENPHTEFHLPKKNADRALAIKSATLREKWKCHIASSVDAAVGSACAAAELTDNREIAV